MDKMDKKRSQRRPTALSARHFGEFQVRFHGEEARRFVRYFSFIRIFVFIISSSFVFFFVIIRRVLPARRRVESRGKRRSLPRREGHDDDHAKCVFPFCIYGPNKAREIMILWTRPFFSRRKKNVKKIQNSLVLVLERRLLCVCVFSLYYYYYRSTCKLLLLQHSI